MLSFIVPAYNEEFELPETLAAIHRAAGSTGQPYEIIVVDDASTDTTAEIARRDGARVVTINRRQIAAARNAGAKAATGEFLFFLDADTRIGPDHMPAALHALAAGYVGGSARMAIDAEIPRWGRVLLAAFSTLYFGANLGAGAFLFTTRRTFDLIGGFDENYFAGEEVHFTLALRRLGKFKILSQPMVTSGRKLRMYSGRYILIRLFNVVIRGRRGTQSRKNLDLWYDGKRETPTILQETTEKTEILQD